jgi:hypothetical protein
MPDHDPALEDAIPRISLPSRWGSVGLHGSAVNPLQPARTRPRQNVEAWTAHQHLSAWHFNPALILRRPENYLSLRQHSTPVAFFWHPQQKFSERKPAVIYRSNLTIIEKRHKKHSTRNDGKERTNRIFG